MLSEVFTNVLITAYDIERRAPHFFKSYRAQKTEMRDYLIRDIARATSAIPSYFEPARFQNRQMSQTYSLIDGGVFANNPAMCAYAEVKAMYPDAQEILLVSFGIGSVQPPYQYEDARDWGTAQWTMPLLNIMHDGIADSVDYQLQHIFMVNPNERNTYMRIVIPVPPRFIEFDDTRDESLYRLQTFTKDFIRSNNIVFDTLVKQLSD